MRLPEIHKRGKLLNIGKERYVLGSLTWEWSHFGLGFSINVDKDLDDLSVGVDVQLLFLGLGATYWHDYPIISQEEADRWLESLGIVKPK